MIDIVQSTPLKVVQERTVIECCKKVSTTRKPTKLLLLPLLLLFLFTCSRLPVANSTPDPHSSSILDSLFGGSEASSSATPSDPMQPAQHASSIQQNSPAYSTSGSASRSLRAQQSAAGSDKVTLPGDILLGGLFPIHMKGAKAECGEINRDRGIQRLEAMLYALDRINADSTLLPNIRLGAILLDSCSSSTYALNQSLEFIRASINTVESSAFECKDKSTPRPKYGSKMIAGVIGGSYSEVSLQVANLLRLFRIPQVSYASTGTALSDKSLYDLFARTVPSDMFQARAIADIVVKLNWTYVSLVSSEGLYGESGSKEFIKQASARRICIAIHEKVSPAMGNNALDSIVANLHKRNATGVVLFTRAEDNRELLIAVKRAKLLRNFAWVAADGWGTQDKLVEGLEEFARGAITVELQAKAIPGFDQYMKDLTPWANARNPWFTEYWQEWFECQLQAELLQQQRVATGAYTMNRRRGAPDAADRKRRHSLSGQCKPEERSDSGQSEGAEAKCINAREIAATKSSSGSDSDSDSRTTTSRQPIRGAGSGAAVSEPVMMVESNSSKNNSRTTSHEHSGQQQQQQRKLSRRKRAQQDPANQDGKVKQFCSPNLRISESNGYRQEQKVQFVVDAVYAMAHALHKAWANLCDAQPGVVCEALKELNGGDFYAQYLLNVSFKDLAGSEVKFDERGDGLGRYNIYNFRQLNRPAQSPEVALQISREQEERQAQQVNPLDQFGLISFAPPGNGSSVAGSGDFAGQGNIRHHHAPAQQQPPPDSDVVEARSGGSGSEDSATELGPGTSGQLAAAASALGNTEFEYSLIGRWSEENYHLELANIQSIYGDQIIPESYCSKPCELGQAKIMRAGDHCCWICRTCLPYEFLLDEFSCKDCGLGRWPVPNKTACFDLPQKVLKWDSVYSLISLTIACLGIALTAFVSVIFIKYLDTPVVKASGRELSFILLAGIAFCHLSTFVLLSKPTTFICGSQRFLVNFGFALMYASLLVKTNRISRIFNCARKSAKRPSFISPKSQMLITGILVAIQIFLTIIWFVLEPPGTRSDSPEGKRDEVILKCRTKGQSFIMSLVYNMILITTCTVYAVKTRKIPENFNESKFIGFTMYTTIVIWLAFVTMFFGTNNSYEIQINTMCVCISLSAYVTLFCLFSPKISIILLHPDKNVRKLTMNSATYKRPFKPVSSMASVDGRLNANLPGGVQNDAGSGVGGPMSTTSNVLNLDGARLQESSIVSNVVNSNSGASNCSAKTPTQPVSNYTGAAVTSGTVAGSTSQQMALLSVCSNCGAHQVTTRMLTQTGSSANLSTASTCQQQQQQQQLAKQNSSHPMNGTSSSSSNRLQQQQARAGSELLQESSRSSGQLVTHAHHTHNQVSASVSGSAALAAAAAAATTVATITSGAKVVHSSRRQATGSGHPKRMASDDQLLQNRRNCGGNFRSTAKTPTGNQQAAQSSSYASSGAIDKGQRIASMGKLNDGNNNNNANNHHNHNNNNSTTSSERVRDDMMDESYSSLLNDSLVNTSQENTPCTMSHGGVGVGNRGNVASIGGHYITGKGSDSMLCNQSVHSLDYCSECCPSYCQCSCPVCSSNGGDGDADSAQAGGGYCIHSATSGLQLAGDGSEPLDDMDTMILYDSNSIMMHQQHPNQVGQQEGELAIGSELADEEYQSAGKIDRRFSDEQSLANEMAGYAGSRLAKEGGNRSKQTRQTQHRCSRDESGATIGKGVSSSSSSTTKRSQTMEMQTIGQPTGSGSSATRSGQQDETSTIRMGQSTNKSTVYALQAAANSALGACAVPRAIPPLKSAPSGRQVSEPNIKNTSIRDKLVSEIQGPAGSGHETGQVITGGGSATTTARTSTTSGEISGTIRASIELVKSTGNQLRRLQADSDEGGGCFNYHDDYEYSYGLVPSDSNNFRPYADQDELDDEDDEPDEDDYADDSDGRFGYGGDNDDDDQESPREAHPIVNRKRHRQGRLSSGRALTTGGDNYGAGQDNLDDDFEHDGRVTLNRSQQQRKSMANAAEQSQPTSSSSRAGSNKSQSRTLKLEMDEHRINSVALITATLSAGGAIVDSSGSPATSGGSCEAKARMSSSPVCPTQSSGGATEPSKRPQ